MTRRPTSALLALLAVVGLLSACAKDTAAPAVTTVPVIDYFESVEVAMDLLRDAGLVGRAPQVDFPHYVTGTVPAAGQRVAVGDTVRLTIGDG